MNIKKILIIFISAFILQCQENPLGDGEIDSDFDPDTGTADTTAPSTPSNLLLTGNSSFTDSPTLSWTASTDDSGEITTYEVALGTSSGGEQVVTFTDISTVTTHQFASLSSSLSSETLYYISVRAKDTSDNYSGFDSLSFYAPGLSQTTSAYHYPNGDHALSCLDYVNSTSYNSEGDNHYWIDPDGDGGNAGFIAYCDMSTDGGGWTLIANRKIFPANVETCGANLNEMFQASCGSATAITDADSYSIGDTALRESILTDGEWLFKQYDSVGTLDSDDAFIIHHNVDLFFTSTGVVNRTAVSQVCDIDNLNCDDTDVEFLWAGTGYFSSSRCNAPWTGGSYYGNYGYCQDGSGGYNSNGLFGNRDNYNETKLWGHPSGGDDYHERIFIR